ncbi:cytochrome c biogenesis CcdA family protein [Gordonia sp. (in: high G+C Gram-positive bacteria)]|uniref:cytochrome c biogenesis CcdA family protein n=1 Tax=Gordonia sp. (in: high G+C Gram-positive bacteria) TaxID=84139 RepID=UPI003C708ABD
MDIGLATAFLGGALSLISPCSALLLPAYFASAVGSGARLVLHTSVFYAGLLLTLVPVGIGIGAAGRMFVEHRSAIVALTGLALVVFGVIAMFGRGFDLAGKMPGVDRLRHAAQNRSGLVKSAVLGAASGAATFCTGPILGAVLTLAAAQGDEVGAGILLAVYGAGIVVPMMLLALTWQRLSDRGRAIIRGREFTALGRTWHTSSVLTGILLIAAGLFYWLTDGFVGVADPVGGGVTDKLATIAETLSRPEVDIALIVLAVGGVLFWWWRGQRRAEVDADRHPAE